MTRALAVLFALALLLAGWQTHRLDGEQAAHADTRRQHADQIAALERAAREATEAARAEEQRRTAEVQKAADEAHQALERARTDAVAAADAGERLRQRIAELTAACRVGAGHPPAAGASSPADATSRVLADVQRRLDQAQNRIARFADSAHVAGAVCERSYDGLTK